MSAKLHQSTEILLMALRQARAELLRDQADIARDLAAVDKMIRRLNAGKPMGEP